MTAGASRSVASASPYGMPPTRLSPNRRRDGVATAPQHAASDQTVPTMTPTAAWPTPTMGAPAGIGSPEPSSVNVDVSQPPQMVSDQSAMMAANNRRLQALAAAVRQPATYAAACREIAAWCEDGRAYSPATLGNLFECLRVRLRPFSRGRAHALAPSHRRPITRGPDGAALERWDPCTACPQMRQTAWI